jgi:hypothetical protein
VSASNEPTTPKRAPDASIKRMENRLLKLGTGNSIGAHWLLPPSAPSLTADPCWIPCDELRLLAMTSACRAVPDPPAPCPPARICVIPTPCSFARVTPHTDALLKKLCEAETSTFRKSKNLFCKVIRRLVLKVVRFDVFLFF